MIVVKVRDREIRVAPTAPVTSGSVGLPVTWTFSEEWEGLTKTAVFRGSDTARDVVLTDDACVVPADVLEESGGPLEIGVRGVQITHDEDADEDIVTVVIPTIWGRIDRIYDGTIPSEADPSVPEPDWTEQVKAAAAEALRVAQGVRQDADDGVFDGASAYEQAVAGGYDGTEAEFNADLAGFSEKEQAAMSAAEAAAQSAQNAANSASTAATKSGEAAQSAATASTHKDAASSSAQSAANSATSAGNSASAAAAFASAANGSATSASASESNAANSATNAAASETAAAASKSAAAASATEASNSAAAAAQSASAIEEYEHDAEAWAIGKRGGTDVDTSDETYQNNAKYYAEQAAASSSSASSAASAAAQSATDAASEAASSQSYSRSSYISSTMASGSATAAAEAQTAAETAASTAEGHATNAASSATAASGSATAAAQSATEAGNASTAATTAKEAAEDAQESAEALVQSIAQSAEQIAQNTADISTLKSQLNTLQPAATASDVGKALIVKTVAGGKPTSYEYGEAGGGGGSDTSNLAPVIINSASGDIASFADGADGLPVKALSVNVEPIQAGTGDPSPGNVRPISGRTSVTINHSGADTSDPEQATIQLGDTVYGATLDVTGGKMVVDRALATLTGSEVWYEYANFQGFYTKLSEMRKGVRQDGISNMLVAFKTSTPGQKNTMWLGVDSQYLFAIGVYETMGSTVADFKSYLATNNLQVVYPLATPIEITLTPTQISTLLGTNNIWSDAGDVVVDYRADTKLYIDNIHTPTDDDMTADAQIASGKYFLIGGTLYKSTTVIPAGDTIIPGTNCIKTNLAEALNALNT